MPPLSLLIKPASGSCNLRCIYCFYADEAQKRQFPTFGFMSDSTMHSLVDFCLREGEGVCTLAFQGGEPTLMGVEFYQRLRDEIRFDSLDALKAQIESDALRVRAYFAEHPDF